jgi:DNA-binding response OmpR family regulator
VEEALTDGGFASDIRSSGEEALTLFKGGLKNYKALVTDVSLKGRISGWEVARQIREIDPACPTASLSKRRSRQRSLSPPFRIGKCPNSLIIR